MVEVVFHDNMLVRLHASVSANPEGEAFSLCVEHDTATADQEAELGKQPSRDGSQASDSEDERAAKVPPLALTISLEDIAAMTP